MTNFDGESKLAMEKEHQSRNATSIFCLFFFHFRKFFKFMASLVNRKKKITISPQHCLNLSINALKVTRSNATVSNSTLSRSLSLSRLHFSNETSQKDDD